MAEDRTDQQLATLTSGVHVQYKVQGVADNTEQCDGQYTARSVRTPVDVEFTWPMMRHRSYSFIGLLMSSREDTVVWMAMPSAIV